jgi:hypothetical protein
VKKILMIVAAGIMSSVALAQTTNPGRTPAKRDAKAERRERLNTLLKQEEEEGEIIFDTHRIFGIKLATDGYGILYERGKFINPT